MRSSLEVDGFRSAYAGNPWQNGIAESFHSKVVIELGVCGKEGLFLLYEHSYNVFA